VSEALQVWLDGWIIQDGNYPDFQAEEHRSFALEFWPSSKLRVGRKAADSPSSMTRAGDGLYAVNGTICFVGQDWWVIDVGIRLYREGKPPSSRIGGHIAGEIGVGIDPFFYFERLSGEPDAPALIYQWRIDRIALDRAPLVLGRRGWERDRARQSWKELAKTAAWSDDERSANYLMTCTRLPEEPRHVL
jgi:hypothetical protein